MVFLLIVIAVYSDGSTLPVAQNRVRRHHFKSRGSVEKAAPDGQNRGIVHFT